MEIVILWIFIGIITGVIGSSKGRSGFRWFCLGFLLSIFGLILVCAMPAINKDRRY